VKRSQRFRIHPWLDWGMRLKQPDDSKGKNPRQVARVWVKAGNPFQLVSQTIF
jgi:hypothetical protein